MFIGMGGSILMRTAQSLTSIAIFGLYVCLAITLMLLWPFMSLSTSMSGRHRPF